MAAWVVIGELGVHQQKDSENLYNILQLDPAAEPEVVAAAYRRLALKYHPDTNKSPYAARRMQDINAAYEILGDPERRLQYDSCRAATEVVRKAPLWQQIGIQMVTIPAGEFLYSDEKQKVYLPEYRLARTPVTNAQYKPFVDAAGHGVPYHWKKGRIPSGKENHPAVWVSWGDAQAFCEWAGCRLPTEQEWEKGARGTDGREYPWGNKWQTGRCNSHEAGMHDTTPVDRYPNGASPYELRDMAGNVWECCDSWWDARHAARVVRGGSRYDSRRLVRCAYRDRYFPLNRDRDVGFRVCASPI